MLALFFFCSKELRIGRMYMRLTDAKITDPLMQRINNKIFHGG